MKSSIILITFFFLCSCSTVTLAPNGESKLSSSPDFQESQSFFIAGLVGKKIIDTNETCNGKPVRQLQTQDTFGDRFLGIITLGIYTPRTAKIWCEK